MLLLLTEIRNIQVKRCTDMLVQGNMKLLYLSGESDHFFVTLLEDGQLKRL